MEDIPEVVKSYKKGWSPNFFRENFHRNAISRALTECSGDDLILISDADEIPNLSILNSVKIKRLAIFDQKNFLYKINLLNSHHWLGSSICYKKHLKSPQWLRNKRFLRRGFLRNIFFKTQILEKGGWHFSFLKSPEDISKKMKAYSHGEYLNFTDVNLIKKNIDSKKFFISPEKELIKVGIDKSFPKFIRDNRVLLSEWIL